MYSIYFREFYLENHVTLMLVALVPVVVIRLFWNVSVWNKIYKTNYIPINRIGFDKAGEFNARFYCMIIFWWIIKKDDPSKIKTYKKIGNWISVISLLIFGAMMTFMSMYGD